jgi:hypothetical protein
MGSGLFVVPEWHPEGFEAFFLFAVTIATQIDHVRDAERPQLANMAPAGDATAKR